MKQLGLGLNLSTKKTRKREFLEEMERVVPWRALVHIVEPHCPRAKTGRPPFAVETMLRIHYLHVWTRRLSQAPVIWKWSAYMYAARSSGKPLHARSLDEIRASRP
jgi:IS5 family transposase